VDLVVGVNRQVACVVMRGRRFGRAPGFGRPEGPYVERLETVVGEIEEGRCAPEQREGITCLAILLTNH